MALLTPWLKKMGGVICLNGQKPKVQMQNAKELLILGQQQTLK